MTTTTHSPDRATFRTLVADVAAKAKARLPVAVNGRVESAVRLVLSYDVELHDDGTALVGSSSDPLKTYTVAGKACDCQDFAYGKAPDGWCQHRIAAAIQQRVQEQLGQADDGVSATDTTTAASLPEAPAAPSARSGMRLEAQVVMDGRQVKVVLWGPDDADVQARLAVLLEKYPAAPAQGKDKGEGSDGPQCPTHGAKKRSTRGKGWYCPHKLEDGSWCTGRAN